MEHDLNSLFGYFSIFPMISLDLVAALSIPSQKKLYCSEWNANFDRVLNEYIKLYRISIFYSVCLHIFSKI
jgi:hypothetical protein